MNDENDLIDLDDEVVAETAEEKAVRKTKYVEDLAARILVRTHSFMTGPNEDDLQWLLNGLANYMKAKGSQVASDKFVLLTWHTATCGECQANEDLSMDSSCVRYDEFVYGSRWMSANFLVEELKE